MTIPSNFIGIDGAVGENYVKPLYSDIPKIITSKTSYGSSNWKLSDAIRCNSDQNFPTITGPSIPSYTPSVNKDKHIGHYGYLQTLHGETVKFDGWYIMWSTTVDFPSTSSNTSGNTYWSTIGSSGYIAYWYSSDGVNWTYGDKLLIVTQPNGSSFQCSSMVVREGTENTVDVFFTLKTPASNTTTIQQSSGKIGSSASGIIMTGFDSMVTMFEPDGVMYETQTQNTDYLFAYPKVFVNPYDGIIYCIFSSTVVNSDPLTINYTGTLPPSVSSTTVSLNGCIGIASMQKSDYISGNFNNWTLMKPIITSYGTVDYMERPSIVFQNGITYIMVNCSGGTQHFNPLISSKTGAYGFYSEYGIFGPYYPINSSGELVLNNTQQTYNVNSYGYFIDQDFYVGYYTGNPSQSTSLSRITVSCGQTLKIVFDHDSSYTSASLSYGRCVSGRDWLIDIWQVTRGNSAPWILDGEVKS